MCTTMKATTAENFTFLVKILISRLVEWAVCLSDSATTFLAVLQGKI